MNKMPSLQKASSKPHAVEAERLSFEMLDTVFDDVWLEVTTAGDDELDIMLEALDAERQKALCAPAVVIERAFSPFDIGAFLFSYAGSALRKMGTLAWSLWSNLLGSLAGPKVQWTASMAVGVLVVLAFGYSSISERLGFEINKTPSVLASEPRIHHKAPVVSPAVPEELLTGSTVRTKKRIEIVAGVGSIFSDGPATEVPALSRNDIGAAGHPSSAAGVLPDENVNLVSRSMKIGQSLCGSDTEKPCQTDFVPVRLKVGKTTSEMAVQRNWSKEELARLLDAVLVSKKASSSRLVSRAVLMRKEPLMEFGGLDHLFSVAKVVPVDACPFTLKESCSSLPNAGQYFVVSRTPALTVPNDLTAGRLVSQKATLQISCNFDGTKNLEMSCTSAISPPGKLRPITGRLDTSAVWAPDVEEIVRPKIVIFGNVLLPQLSPRLQKPASGEPSDKDDVQEMNK